MASTEPPPATNGDVLAPTESEPLLGRPGDATQKPDAPLITNLVLGAYTPTAPNSTALH